MNARTSLPRRLSLRLRFRLRPGSRTGACISGALDDVTRSVEASGTEASGNWRSETTLEAYRPPLDALRPSLMPASLRGVSSDHRLEFSELKPDMLGRPSPWQVSAPCGNTFVAGRCSDPTASDGFADSQSTGRSPTAAKEIVGWSVDGELGSFCPVPESPCVRIHREISRSSYAAITAGTSPNVKVGRESSFRQRCHIAWQGGHSVHARATTTSVQSCRASGFANSAGCPRKAREGTGDPGPRPRRKCSVYGRPP
jgi:hypothetical protein